MSFASYIRESANLSQADIDKILSVSEAVTIEKGGFFLRQGEICRHKIFVTKGLLRNFGTSDNGSEQIIQFCPENSWTLDVESFDNGTPARFNIAAVENSEILIWTKSDFRQLCDDFPALNAFSQQLISRNIHNSRYRILSALNDSPEEKYERFLSELPNLVSRVPLHMIASYLGISLKTLTRLRHARLQK